MIYFETTSSYHTRGVYLRDLITLQVPVDYTWANEILDHELPGLVKKRQSVVEAEAVSYLRMMFCESLHTSLHCCHHDECDGDFFVSEK